MIRRFNKLKNIGRFVDLRSQTGHQGEFSKLNVIYAQNASGKSTLCDVLRSLSTTNPDYVVGRKRFGSTAGIEVEVLLRGTPAPKAILANDSWRTDPAGIDTPKVMVYDDRFVADNVHIGHHVAVEQRRNLYGLVIGERGIALKEQVDNAERELNNATNALNLAKSALTAVIPNGWDIDSFRTLSEDENVDQRISEANEELDAAKSTKRNADAIRQRNQLQKSNIAEIPVGISGVLETTLDEIAHRAETQIREHLEKHSRGLGFEWVEQGHNAQIGTDCPHCGQEMEGLELFKAYRVFFSGELQKQQDAQRDIIRVVEQVFGQNAQQQLQQILKAHLVERDWWRDAVSFRFDLPTCKPVENILAEMEAVRTAVIGAIQRKQLSPAFPIRITEAEEATLAAWEQTYVVLSTYMEGLDTLNINIADYQRNADTVDIAKIESRFLRLKAQKRRHEPEVNTAYAGYDLAVATKMIREREKTNANTALKVQSDSILAEYGGRINTLLDLFQADFRVVSGGVNFRGGPPSGELGVEIRGTRVSTTPDDARNPSRPSLANTLSSGDRSALGLAFFLAVVEHDPNIGDTVVVFDDPFHSQDRSRRRRTVEYIHKIANNSKQCFVLSHDLDFAREAARIAGVEVNTFKMNPMTDHSMLQAGDLPPLPGRAYEKDYAKLTDYLRNPATYADQLKDVTRCLRQTLEGYLHTKFPESWAENDWLGDMIGKIRAAQPGELLYFAAHLVTDLTAVNDYSKRFYHGETDTSDAADVDPRELKGYVEQALKIISC